MKKNKLPKIKVGTELAQISDTLQALTGLTLDDVIRQTCSQTQEENAYWELLNITKMDNYLKTEKQEIH